MSFRNTDGTFKEDEVGYQIALCLAQGLATALNTIDAKPADFTVDSVFPGFTYDPTNSDFVLVSVYVAGVQYEPSTNLWVAWRI